MAASLNNLALLYYTQGQYAEAEPLYRRARLVVTGCILVTGVEPKSLFRLRGLDPR